MNRVYFRKQNVVITDPLNIKYFQNSENWNRLISEFHSENEVVGDDFIVGETGIDNWFAEVYSCTNDRVYDSIGTTSGYICVCDVDEYPLAEDTNDEYVIIKDVTGDVIFHPDYETDSYLQVDINGETNKCVTNVIQ